MTSSICGPRACTGSPASAVEPFITLSRMNGFAPALDDLLAQRWPGLSVDCRHDSWRTAGRRCVVRSAAASVSARGAMNTRVSYRSRVDGGASTKTPRRSAAPAQRRDGERQRDHRRGEDASLCSASMSAAVRDRMRITRLVLAQGTHTSPRMSSTEMLRDSQRLGSV